MNDVGDDGAIVEYGINGFILTAYGTTEKFVDGGAAHHAQYIHRVSTKQCGMLYYHSGRFDSKSLGKLQLGDVILELWIYFTGDIEKFNAQNAIWVSLWQQNGLV